MPHEYVYFYVIPLAILIGGGVLVGVIFRWWGLIASVGLACFFVYGWQFDPAGILYAAIGGAIGSAAVVAGSLLRGRRRVRH